MDLFNTNFQINFFTNNDDVSATPPILAMLLSKLSGLSLLPMFGQEINFLSGEKKQIVIMTEASQNFKIEFQSHTIVLTGQNISLDDFLAKAYTSLHILKEIFPQKKSNRLAFVSNNFFKGTVDEFDSLYKKLFTFHEAMPLEWDNRIVLRNEYNKNGDMANCVSTIKRGLIQSSSFPGISPLDVVSFEIDINTLPEITSHRFELDTCHETLKSLTDENKKMAESLSRYTGE